MTPQVMPYGEWPSPLGADQLGKAARVFGMVAFLGDMPCWEESRPEEGGRVVVVGWRDGEVVDLTPPDANVRTRLHEYGGRSYLVEDDGSLVYSEFTDQRLHRVRPGGRPEPLTPEPPRPTAWRYADLTADPIRDVRYAVRERHEADRVHHEVVALPAAGGEPRIIASGHDFFAAPRPSPDGRRLAWLSWDHPRMPWDGTDLWVASITDDASLGTPIHVAGGEEESIFQPHWSPDGVLHFTSDRSGYWNLYRVDQAGTEALQPMEAEFGVPLWRLGMATTTFPDRDGGRLVCQVDRGGRQELVVLSPGSPSPLRVLDLPFTAFRATIAAAGGKVLTVAAGPRTAPAVVLVDVESGEVQVLRESADLHLSGDWIPVPELLTFPVAGGDRAHAVYYPPRNPEAAAPVGERPPLLVHVHGGPTAQVPAVLLPGTVYWTSRGFAVVHVNYGGSSGYGRAYRERLRGQWGVVDVDDAVAAARFLADRGDIDGNRMAITGGSAGGFTALCAAAFREVFQAAVSYFGVSDTERLARETHAFESRYFDGLIGRLPQDRERYRARSPLYAAGDIRCATLLLQGLRDEVVPASQSEEVFRVLRANRVPVAYVTFPEEGHGFRAAAAIQHATECELVFYAQVFGLRVGGGLPALELMGSGQPRGR